MIRAALDLAALGWRVHPVYGLTPEGVCTCARGAACGRSAGKHPVLPGWPREASADPDVIMSWDWTGRNLGVVPDGWTILDFDGAEGLRTLAAMLEVLPELPATPMVRTGSGGVHVYLAGEARNPCRVLPGLDVRSTGGQAVAPPSTHYSGDCYTWLQPPGPLGEAPAWLAVARGEIPDVLRPRETVSPDEFRAFASRAGKLRKIFALVLEGAPFAEPGSRDDTMARLAGSVAHRWPRTPAADLGGFFAASLAAMASDPDAPALEKMIDRISYFQSQQQDPDGRPSIVVGTDVSIMTQGVVEILAKLPDLGIYSRGGRLTRVRPLEILPDGVLRSEQPPAFEIVPQPLLLGVLSHEIRWTKPTKNGESPTLPPSSVVGELSALGAWDGIPHAEALSEGPVLRPDGSVFPGGGYDEITGVICVGAPYKEPPKTAQESLDILVESVIDFPFASGEHFTAWLASVLTAVGRTAFRGPSPLFLIDANVRGSGKSLLAELAVTISGGRAPDRCALGSDNEEDRKQITARAVAGSRHILIDNVSGKFGTPKLCEALSLHGGVWSDRILGESTVWSGPFLPTWWATGNNVSLGADMARRVVHVRLESPEERPEERRGFAHPALLAWAYDRRRELHHAALSILYRYCEAGRPSPVGATPWGGFEAWSDFVRGAVLWMGLPDPAETRVALAQSDEEEDFGQILFAGLAELPVPLTAGEIVETLYAPAESLAEASRYSALREALDGLGGPSGRRPSHVGSTELGRVLSKYRDRKIRGLTLRRDSSRRWRCS